MTTYAIWGRDEVAREVVRKCIGANLLAGWFSGAGDGWIIAQYGKDMKASGEEGNEAKEAVKLAEEKSQGHYVTSLVIAGIGLGMLYV